jgi:methyltransferase-like protein/ubiquinone/menaquinone biosynthesis C-methylase UbiE
MTKPTFIYNEIPYPTMPRWRTHPNHLAALAWLLGLNPAPVEGCRVLDLGCGNGKNLIPMAYQLPKSEFVGLDLSANQIAAGQSWVTALGLNNITLKVQNILDIEASSWGQFDYIIAYGVYSWVAPELQNKILDIYKQLLSPHGVAYISYNTYPGWSMHGQIRGMMLYYTRQLDEPYTQAKQAREVLDFFAETIPTLSSSLSGPLQINSLILQNLRDLLKPQPDEYLLHDHLEAINEPLYLYQFVERAEQHGLQYLADAESSPLINNYLPPQFVRSIEGLAKSPVELEQLMDFLYMRSFRQTLLCHQGLPLNRQPGPERLKSLTIASSAKPVTAEIDLHSDEEVRFRNALGASLTTGQPFNKAALLYLAEIWPQGVSFDRLLTIARSRLNPTASLVYNTASLTRETETLGSFLLKGYALNLIELRASAPHFTLEINEYPVVSALARLQAREGRQVTNQCHEIVTLDNEISHYLLPYLDGHHNRTQLLEELLALVKAGTLVVQVEDQAASESEPVQQILVEALEQTLRYLAQNALLVG